MTTLTRADRQVGWGFVVLWMLAGIAGSFTGATLSLGVGMVVTAFGIPEDQVHPVVFGLINGWPLGLRLESANGCSCDNNLIEPADGCQPASWVG